MGTFFVLIFLASVVALVVGLIKPTVFARIKITSRKSVALVFITIAFISLIASGTDNDKSGGVYIPTKQQEKIKPSSDKEYTELFMPLVDEAKAVIDDAVPLLTEENPKNAPKLRGIAERLGDTVTKMTNITPPKRFEQPHWVFIGGVDTYIHAFTLVADGWENNSQEQLTQATQLIIEASNDIRRATEAIK